MSEKESDVDAAAKGTADKVKEEKKTKAENDSSSDDDQPLFIAKKPAAAPAAAAAAAATAGTASKVTKPMPKIPYKSDAGKGQENKRPINDSSSDDDDAPLASKTKPAAAAAKVAPKATPKKEAGKKEETKKKEEPKKKKKEESSSEEEEEDDSSSEEESSDEDSSDSDDKKRKKKPAKATPKKKEAAKVKQPAKKPKKEESSDEDDDAAKKKRTKPEGDSAKPESKRKKAESSGPQVYQWWKQSSNLAPGQKWAFLEHHGVTFAAPYAPHGVHILYKGESVALTPEAEEVATMYAAMINTDYMGKKQFKDNFWNHFKVLVRDTIIKELKYCDFQPIVDWVVQEREKKKNMTKEEKKELKTKKDAEDAKYMFALVDDHTEQTGNFRVEPPGLFRGRGEHPKMGELKKRMCPEDIIMNCSKDACPPRCPVPGHSWQAIVHNTEATWLAFWQDSINHDSKYVWLSAASALKGQADREKFEVARKLQEHIPGIRETYAAGILKKDQLSTALWLIDNLALRVGNEKDPDEQADTVGCCSLRCEHVTVDLSDPEKPTFELDFLGKDSIRFNKTITMDDVREHQRENLKVICRNLQDFKKGKKPGDDIFDSLTTTMLNNHLKTLVPELKVTAKVFRTFNASITLVEQLAALDKLSNFPKGYTVPQLCKLFNDCNFQVAKLCNHSRSKPKNFDESMAKANQALEDLEKQLEEIKAAAKKEKDDKEKSKMKKKIETLGTQIEKKNLEIQTREKLSEVALGTSKINYIDPRITVSWCKKVGIPIEKIFNKSLMTKFTWAIQEAEDDWTF